MLTTIGVVGEMEATVYEAFYPAGMHMPAHYDRQCRISIVVSGQVKETVGCEDVFGSAAGVVVKPKHARHSNTFGPEGAYLASVELPDRFLEDLDDQVGLDTWRWYHSGVVSTISM